MTHIFLYSPVESRKPLASWNTIKWKQREAHEMHYVHGLVFGDWNYIHCLQTNTTLNMNMGKQTTDQAW